MAEWKPKPRRSNTYVWKEWTVYKAIVVGFCVQPWVLKRGEEFVARFRRQDDAMAYTERDEAKRG